MFLHETPSAHATCNQVKRPAGFGSRQPSYKHPTMHTLLNQQQVLVLSRSIVEITKSSLVHGARLKPAQHDPKVRAKIEVRIKVQVTWQVLAMALQLDKNSVRDLRYNRAPSHRRILEQPLFTQAHVILLVGVACPKTRLLLSPGL